MQFEIFRLRSIVSPDVNGRYELLTLLAPVPLNPLNQQIDTFRKGERSSIHSLEIVQQI